MAVYTDVVNGVLGPGCGKNSASADGRILPFWGHRSCCWVWLKVAAKLESQLSVQKFALIKMLELVREMPLNISLLKIIVYPDVLVLLGSIAAGTVLPCCFWWSNVIYLLNTGRVSGEGEIALPSSDGLGSSSRPQNFSYFFVAHPTCSLWIF